METSLHQRKTFFGQETLREGQVSIRVSMQESAGFQH